MKPLTIFKSMSIGMIVVGLAACDKPGPAETAGEKMDQAIAKAGEKMEATGTNVGVALADSEITAKVKAAILAEPGLKTLQISVDTVKGVVTLTGSVDTQSQSDTAGALAGAVEGVTRVDNRLSLKPVSR